MKTTEKKVQFVANKKDNLHCVAACFRMLHKYYFGSDLSWEEMDRIGHFQSGKGMWTFPYELWLAKKGLQIRSIEQVDYKRLHKQPVKYLQTTFGKKNADYYINKSNLMTVLEQIPEYMRLVGHEVRSTTVGEIVKFVKEGYIVVCEVNSQILNKLPKFNLHMILMYEYQDDCLLIHDPGLPPISGRKLTLEEFNECFNYPGGNPGASVFRRI